MNIKQLKEKIKDLPDLMDVFMDERISEFKFGLVNSVEVKKINMTEEPGGEVLAQEKVLIISEE